MKKRSLYAGSYAGIKVFIHWSFWILIAWIFIHHFKMEYGWVKAVNAAVFILTGFLVNLVIAGGLYLWFNPSERQVQLNELDHVGGATFCCYFLPFLYPRPGGEVDDKWQNTSPMGLLKKYYAFRIK